MAGEWTGLARSTRNLPNIALRLGEMKQRGDLVRSQQALSAKDLDIRGTQSKAEYGPGGLAERRVGATEKRNELLETQQKREASQDNPALKPISPGRLGMIRATIMNVGGQLGTKLNVTNIMNDIQQETEAGSRAIDVYRKLKNPVYWKEASRPLLEGIQKDLEKAVAENDKEKAQRLTGLIDAISSGKILDVTFSASAQMDAAEKAAIVAKEIAVKTNVLSPGAVLVDSSGKTLAENKRPKIVQPRAIKSWIGPDNKILNLPNNQQPPPGSKPYSKPKAPKDKAKMAKTLLDVENTIVSNQGHPAQAAFADFFNKFGDKKKYIFVPGKVMVPIPKKDQSFFGAEEEEVDGYVKQAKKAESVQEMYNRLRRSGKSPLEATEAVKKKFKE